MKNKLPSKNVKSTYIKPKPKLKKVIKKSNKNIQKKFITPAKQSILSDPLNYFTTNLGFLILKRSLFFSFVTGVLTKMRTNINYPIPDPPLSDIDDTIDNFKKAKASRQTSLALTYYKDIKKLMKQLAIYVANNCGNDENVFKSSGFKYNSKKKRKSPRIKGVKIKKLRDSKRSGQVIACYDAIDGAGFYEGRWKLKGEPDSAYRYGTTSLGLKMLFDELPIMNEVDIQVRACGAKEKGNWSVPRFIIVR